MNVRSKTTTENPAGSPTVRPAKSDGVPKSPEEFSRFESLAGKLVNVPKEEVDEKRREES
jgi:hypothetical protein